jgi:hypothetical protein
MTVSWRQKYGGFHPKPGRRIHCRYSEIEIFPTFKGLQDMAERRPLIGKVRGRSLTIGTELVKDKRSREPAPVETAKVVYRAYELGLIVYYVGLFSKLVRAKRRCGIYAWEGYIVASFLAVFTLGMPWLYSIVA